MERSATVGGDDSYRARAERLGYEADRCFDRGRFDEAEQAVRTLLDLQRATLGTDHAEIAASLCMLGELRFVRADLPGAESAFRQALAIRGRVLGERHLDYAATLHNLALIVWERGALDEAEALLSRTHEIRLEHWGEHHPDTLRTRTSLETIRAARASRGGGAPRRPAAESPPPEQAVLQAALSALEARLAQAATALHGPGTIEPAELVNELAACQREFQRLLGQARHLATEPPDLARIEELLDVIGELAQLHADHDAARNEALSVLDEVLALTARRPEVAVHLAECQERARALRATVAGATWDRSAPEVESLAGGEHPFAHLLVLVRDRDRLTDADWARRHRAVSEALGRPLAAAANRQALAVPGSEPSRAVAPPPPAKAVSDPWSALSLEPFQAVATATASPAPAPPPPSPSPGEPLPAAPLRESKITPHAPHPPTSVIRGPLSIAKVNPPRTPVILPTRRLS